MSGSRRALAAALVALTAACETRAPARLELGDATPERAPGAALARIEVRNAGAQSLLLHGVRLDCGCRLASALPDTLAGGERATLVVRCRDDGTGAAREVRVASSDPEHTEASVRFTLPGHGAIAVEPPALYFGYVAVGASAAREVALPAAADALTANAPELQIEERPPRTDGRRIVRVRFTPRRAGPLHAALALGARADVVPVSGVGYRTLLAFPAELTLPGELSAGAPPAIALKNVGASTLEITGVEAPPGLTPDLQTTVPGREFRLVLRGRSRVDAGGGVILLRTSDVDEPVITIPVHDGSA